MNAYRSLGIGVFLVAMIAGCGGSGLSGMPNAAAGAPNESLDPSRMMADTVRKNVVKNGRFEGKLSPWTSCGTAKAAISSVHPYDGKYDAVVGSSTKQREVKGWSAICQIVMVPANATLTAELYRVTNEEDEKDSYQEIALADASGKTVKPIYALEKGNANHAGWIEAHWSLAEYAGKVRLFFGVYGSGRSKFYDTMYIDHVTLVAKLSTPTPSPRPSKTPKPTPSPTASSTPTPSPAPTPTLGPLTANPATLSFSSAASQTFLAEESGYSGAFSASSSDTSVATVSVGSSTGPSSTFAVTPGIGGNATIPLQDSLGNRATVTVTVYNGIIKIDGVTPQPLRGGNY